MAMFVSSWFIVFWYLLRFMELQIKLERRRFFTSSIPQILPMFILILAFLFSCVYSQTSLIRNSFHTQNCLINRRWYWSSENNTVCVWNWTVDLEIIMKEKLKVDWYIPSKKWPVGRDVEKKSLKMCGS